MKIAIIVAMQKELELLRPVIEECSDNGRFLTGRIGRHDVAVMQSGIGKVNAALATKELIDAWAPDMVLNTGVAGGAGAGIPVGDIVVGERVAYHDVDCGPGTVKGQVDGCPRFFEGAKTVTSLACVAATRRGLICSGDVFVADGDTVRRILSLYPDALAIDMESAAIAHCCHRYGMPFCSLRVVSDTPGQHEDNTSQYLDFWNHAPQSTFRMLRAILDELPC